MPDSRSGPGDEGILRTTDLQAAEFFDQALLPMSAVSVQGVLLRVNDEMCQLVGRAREDLVGTSAVSLCREASGREAVESALAAAGSGESRGQLAVEVLVADGGVATVRLSWTLALDPGGDPWYLTAVLVRERPRGHAERALAASETRWRTLLSHAADIIWTADAEGVVLSASAALPGKGWQLHGALGRRVIDFVHGDDVAAFQAAWERVRTAGGGREVLESRIRRADGTWRWVQQTLTDLGSDPQVRAIIGTVVDITERREREEADARREQRSVARFERSRAPQARVDLEGVLSAANPAFCDLVERTWDELRGHRLSWLGHRDDDGQAEEALALILTGAQESAQVHQIVAGREQGTIPVSVELTLTRDHAGRPQGASVFLYDLTRLRERERQREQQDEFFAAIGRLATELSFVSDTEGQLVYVSPVAIELFGHSVAESLEIDRWDLIHPDDVDTARAAFAEVVERGGSRTLLLRLRAKGGEWRWVEETATNLLESAVGGVVSGLRDVTERVEAERALRASEARYRTFADVAEEGIWAVETNGQTLYANARMANILGLPLQELYDNLATTLLDPQEGQGINQALAQRGQRGTERYEIGYQHPDQSERRLWIVATPLPGLDGGHEGSLAMVSDVTEIRRTEQQLLSAALLDALTGLPNRALLFDRLEQALNLENGPTAVLFVDLDRFKFVNDSRGHTFGDQLLVAVAERLLAVARPSDTVARSGGDEFTIVCVNLDEEQAEAEGQRLLAALGEPFEVAGAVLHIGASIGVATTPPPSASDLLRYADTAMYAAKAAGRGRIRLFDRALTEETEQRYALIADLRVALAQDTLTMQYQPIIDLSSGRVRGMEGLARWTHPTYGQVPPDRFVALAELSGQGSDLDQWALRRALREATALVRAGATGPDAYVAVNLSAANLAGAGVEELVVATAKAAGTTPSQVLLEITESAIMQETEVAVGVLRRLRARGFQIAIDDFGTGYSSLAYLRDLPITHLKIDRTFVTHIAEDPDALAVVASIIDLARAVGIVAVAEGVETAEQATLLARLGCPVAQGWLWSRALPPEEIAATGAFLKPFEVGNGDLLKLLSSRAETGRAVGAEHGLLRMLELHRKGASLVTIADTLNREGFRSPDNLRWHGASVARAIAEAAYPTLAAS